MSLQLRPDELLAALNRLKHPEAGQFEDRLMTLSRLMAQHIVDVTPNVTRGLGDYWDEMLCIPIRPIDPSQPIPDHLKGFDDEGWE